MVIGVCTTLGGDHITMIIILGLCHNLCTMVFHSLGVVFICMRVHSCPFSFISPPSLVFSKGVLGRLIRRAMAVWWLIKGSALFILNLSLHVYLYNFQSHHYCPPLSCSGNLKGYLPCKVMLLHLVDRLIQSLYFVLHGI